MSTHNAFDQVLQRILAPRVAQAEHAMSNAKLKDDAQLILWRLSSRGAGHIHIQVAAHCCTPRLKEWVLHSLPRSRIAVLVFHVACIRHLHELLRVQDSTSEVFSCGHAKQHSLSCRCTRMMALMDSDAYMLPARILAGEVDCYSYTMLLCEPLSFCVSRRNVLEKREQCKGKILAFCMGQQKRLGQDSCVQWLDDCLVDCIAEAMIGMVAEQIAMEEDVAGLMT